MPIELWWWVIPLWFTGYLTAVVFGAAAYLLDTVIPDTPVPIICAIIAVMPWVICALAGVVWLIANALIVIWR